MRIANVKKRGGSALAVRRAGVLVDLSVAAPDLPRDLSGLLAAGKGALSRAWRVAWRPQAKAIIKGRVSYLPPIENPSKIICVGLNYSDHAAEAGLKPPIEPILFARFPTTLTGHRQPLIRPKASREFDYEGELVAVIGSRARNISKRQALSCVAGYSIFNEASLRDYQLRVSQWTMGKNFDATGGFGPDFVSADELPAGAKGLKLITRLNGKVVQDGTTSDMIFDVATLVSFASKAMTLLPGDIIVTGTPAGVGFTRKPPLFMKAGDICDIEIEGIGVLSNPIRAER